MLVVHLVDETAWFLPAGTLEGFRTDLDLTYAQAGTVLTLGPFGAAAGLVFSVVADHCSRRLIAAGGAFGFSVALAVFAAGGSFPVLAAASFGAGVAATAMVDAAEIALVDVAGVDLRRCLTRMNLLGGVGDLAGPTLVAAVALAGGSWRVAFWAGAGLLAAYAALLAASPLPGPGGDRPDEEPAPRGALWAVLTDGRVWLLGVASMLLSPFDEPFLAFTVALLERARDVPAGVANLVAVVGTSGGLVAFAFVAPRLSEAKDRRTLAVSGVAMAGGSLVIALVPLLPLVVIAAFAVSVAVGVAWLAVQHRMLVIRPGQTGTTKAVVSAIELGGFGVPIAIGALADGTGLPAAMCLYALLALTFAALARLCAPSRRRVPVR